MQLIRPPGDPFTGRITEELFGAGWDYDQPREYGRITDPVLRTWLAAHPLAEAILVVYADFNAAGMLPVGPRGCGYVLLGSTIDGRLVVKDKKKVSSHITGRKERTALLVDYVDFADIGNAITALRRAALLRSDWVADGRSEAFSPLVAVNADQVKKTLRDWSEDFGPDILNDQDVYLEVWCEAADLAQSVGGILGDYGVSVYSGSGDVPLRAIRLAATRYELALDAGKEVVVLLIGDYDIDGLGNADRFVEDIEAHLPARHRDTVDWRWVAPREEHLTDYPVLAPAAGDPVSLSKSGKSLAFTMQAEALVRGGVLRTLLTAEVEDVLDMDAVEATRGNWDEVEVPAIEAALS